MNVRSSERPPTLAVYDASSTTTSPDRITWASGSSASRRAASRPMASRIRASSSAGPGGVQHHVVHAPVVGDDGEAALGHHEQHRDVGAGRADQPAQVAGVGQLEPAVDEQQVGVRGLEQGAALGREDPDLVAEQGQPGQHLDRGLQRVGQQEQGAHLALLRGTGTTVGEARTSLADGEGYRAMEPPSHGRLSAYWASARAAAGVAEDAVPVDRPVTLAELRDRAVALHPGTRLEAVLGVCSVLVGDRPVASRRTRPR